jgi:hypothetical protein
MSDTSSTFPLAAARMGPTEQIGDAGVMMWFGAALLLALFILVAMLLPFDMAGGPQYAPTLFGP